MSVTELNEFLAAMDIVRDAIAAALNNAGSLPLDETTLVEGWDWFDTPLAPTLH